METYFQSISERYEDVQIWDAICFINWRMSDDMREIGRAGVSHYRMESRLEKLKLTPWKLYLLYSYLRYAC